MESHVEELIGHHQVRSAVLSQRMLRLEYGDDKSVEVSFSVSRKEMTERAALARVIHELKAIEPLISEAASQANPDARIRLQYGWLRQDLNRIRLGIREHIDTPRAEPRTFPPLRGDYRR